ncbi:discoidin domain-containing protein [Chitinophaga rhizophila]|uniref:alpha-L-fucosidase n=1 Tax=Chitinophaga rhizophila TaxID=2866212 RepID=A0ABS7GBR8_9BACT|nr:discoidin domain-containing protein [Chitinophaga rhizophila]MBW8685120.1 alpha-L-fucosidase [Chitinophaga rhizophila]
MKKFLLTAGLCCSLAAAHAQEIAPYGALPSKAQLDWQHMEYYMFIHLGPNTFTDNEWGHGDEDPKVFNPSQLDARQWARTAKEAGMKAIIITAKHHDGFCLWPSKYSTHTVRESSWKDGKGDVLKELSEACKEYGLKFGVYLSPWDRNHPAYGTPEYNQVFVNTLDEVLSGYGPVFEQWFDGANGEGPNGKRPVYDWPLFHKTVYKNQPNAVIFSDIGPGCRWVGNEDGIAGTTNWSTLNVTGFTPGKGAPAQSVLNEGNINGEKWIPAECDVSIRPGWFYSPSTDDKVKSVQQLLDIYYGSVGRNGNMLLNVPVDRRGLIYKADSIRLMEFRKMREASFKVNLAKNAKVTATETRKGNAKVSARNLTDGKTDTYWATPDNIQKGSITLKFTKATTFNRLVVQEYITLGQRVKAFNIEVLENGVFKEIANATTIGHKRILSFPDVTTTQVRINIQDALACPVISEVQLFRAPGLLAVPMIQRNKNGEVSITCSSSDPELHYTLDGKEPTYKSPKYTGFISLPQGGVVKAKAFLEKGKVSSTTVSAVYDIAPAKWRVIYTDGQAAGADPDRAIDGNPNSFWMTNYQPDASKYPHEIQVDMSESLTLKGFTYTPRHQTVRSGTIYGYEFYVSEDGENWGSPVAHGNFANIANNPVMQTIKFNKPVKGRYIRLVATAPANDNEHWASVAELGIITR